MDVKVTSMSFGSYVDEYGFCVEVELADVADHIDGKHYYQIRNLHPKLVVERIGGAGHFTQLECQFKIHSLGFVAKESFGVTIPAPNTACELILPFNGFVPLGKIEPQKATFEMEILDKGRVVFGGQLPIAFVNLQAGVS